jgi:hypothetical protein
LLHKNIAVTYGLAASNNYKSLNLGKNIFQAAFYSVVILSTKVDSQKLKLFIKDKMKKKRF